MSAETPQPPRVLISYSHDSSEHAVRVLKLAQELRKAGVDARMDQLEPNPEQGWPRWMQEQVERADFLILVCTETYKRRYEGRERSGVGRGVSWEGLLATQLLYEGTLGHHQLVPVLIDEDRPDHIPLSLRPSTHYPFPAQFDRLCAHLLADLSEAPVPLGTAKVYNPMPARPEPAAAAATIEAILARTKKFEGPGQAPARHVPFFTGREIELAELERLFDDTASSCVVVAGTGGVGKTVLAQHYVATRAPARFPEGVAWLDAKSLVSELARVARRFGYEGDREPTSDEAISFLHARLPESRVLLVVDDFDPDTERPKYAPRPGGLCRTLVTSRSLTADDRLDARQLRVGVWSEAECIAYLRERSESLERATYEDIAPLGAFVGHLPLGVRLVSAFLGGRASLTPAKALKRLKSKALSTLDKYANEDIRGVAATFQDSFDSLDEPEVRRALQAMAVCAKATRTEVVEAVSGIEDLDEWLDELRERSLVEFRQDSEAPWSMHDLVRMFVLEQPGGEEFESDHTAWVLRHIEQHTEDSAWEGFSIGVDEARAAFERHARDFTKSHLIYEPLENHLRVVGRYQEAIALSKRLLEAAPDDSQVVAIARNNLGLCYASLGDTLQAIDEHEKSLSVAKTLARLQGQVTALGNLGSCHRTLGNIPEAIGLHGRALAISKQLSTLGGEADQLSNLGSCYLTLGDLPKAIELIQRSLVIDGHLGRRGRQAAALGNIGLCYRKLGHVSQAIDFFKHDLAIQEELGHRGGCANALINLGGCYRMLEDFPKAIEFLERALALDVELGRREGQAIALGNLGGCYLSQGHVAEAVTIFERALDLEEKDGRREGQATQLGSLGISYLELRDVPKAIGFFERGLTIGEELGSLDCQASCIGNLGGCYLALGDIPKAIEFLERALCLHEKLGSIDGQANVLGNLGLVEAEHGAPELARDYLGRALDLYRRVGLPAPPHVPMLLEMLTN